MPYCPMPYLKWFLMPYLLVNSASLAMFSADIFSADGTKWSSATHTLSGSHSLSVDMP